MKNTLGVSLKIQILTKFLYSLVGARREIFTIYAYDLRELREHSQ
jgi:hypothetical protein